MWQVKREVLFEKTVPNHRWNPGRYAEPAPRPKNKWRLKSPDKDAKLNG